MSGSRYGSSVRYEAPELRQTGMPDPQQARFAAVDADADAGAFVAPRVVPAVFPRLERTPPGYQMAAAAAAAVPEAMAQAKQIIDEARATARAMLAQARDVIAAEREQAVARGLEEGRAQGMAEADAEMAGLVRTCEQIGVHVMQERERVLAENEADLVELAMAIARRVVNASVELEPELVIEACRGAMRKAFQRGNLQVLAHPHDLERLRAAGPELARELGGVDHLDFVEERRIDAGSVIVRTPAGEIDGTIAGKTAKIEDALREGLEARRAARHAA